MLSKSNQKKITLGQVYTTRYNYILQGFDIPDCDIIEPFAGQGDLVQYIHNKFPSKIVECYDIDPKCDFIIQRDTLLNPPSYYGKYVITNPPYLARNKSNDKTIYDKYDANDLYKCFIACVIKDVVDGGILIIPLNFWSSIRKMDIMLRKEFMNIYQVVKINIFEESVFDDTTYTVCSFQFNKKTTQSNDNTHITFYPSCDKIDVRISDIIGGEIYHLPIKNKFVIGRLTSVNTDNITKTNLLVKCIDDNMKNKINMSFVDDSQIYIDNTPNLSARSYMTLTINPIIPQEDQKRLAERFNKYLNLNRSKYHSLFLTNYRESNDISRKRISFKLIYDIVAYLLENDNI